MRILFLSMEFPPETGGGGIGSYVASVTPALAARGHEVHVLSCVPGQPAADVVVEGVHLHRRGQVRIRGFSRVLRSPSAHARVQTAISCWLWARRLGLTFDVVEFPDWMAEGLLFTLLASMPTVGHLHTPLRLIREHNGLPMDWDARLGDRIERAAIRSADLVTSPSRLLANKLLQLGWIRTERLSTIPHPVDLERWNTLPSPEHSPPRVLAVGRLEPCKAPELLVEAAALLKEDVPHLELVFIGRSAGLKNGLPYLEWVSLLAVERGVRCRFVGQVPRHELSAWYAGARVLAVPSWFDSFSMAALEAMASSRPVVCTDQVGAGELIQEFECGRVVPPGNPRALAEALRPYLTSPALAARDGRLARRAVELRCSPEAVAHAREAVYEEARELWRDRLCQQARGFPHAAPKLSSKARRWYAFGAREAAETPWKHFYLRAGDLLSRLLEVHPSFAGLNLNGVRALDLGTTPHVAMILASLGAQVTVLDIDPKELHKASALARTLGLTENVKSVLADAFSPPFLPASFDLVWNSGFIEHFDDPVKIVSIMADLTRPGGAVCILTPAKWTLHSMLVRRWLRRSSAGYYWDFMGQERSYGRKDLEHILFKAGLRPLESVCGDLRRAILDDNLVLSRLARPATRRLVYGLMNALDWLESRVPSLGVLGFTVGAIGVREPQSE